MHKIHRQIQFSLIAGAFFTFAFYFGAKFCFAYFNDKPVEYSVLDIVNIIPIGLAISLSFFFLLDFKPKLKPSKKFNLKFWHIFVPLMISSIIIFLAYFPGHFPFDSSEMYDYFKTGAYGTHYSPLVSFVLGIFISIGEFFGSNVGGHAAFVIIQFVILNLILAKIIFYCSEKLKKKSFGIVLTIFFALNPFVQSLFIRSGQDTIFAGLFLLICFEFLKISENEKYFLEKKKKKFIYLFCLIFFFCASRNNGIYALIPVLISAFFILKNNKQLRKNFFIALSTPIVAFLGYNYLFINNIVATGDSFYRETMNVPVMQIARAMYYNPDENFKEELKVYFKEDCKTWTGIKWNWSKYNSGGGISDPYKNCLITEEINKNPLKFFNLWARIGLKNALSYIEAPAVFMLGLYYPYLPYDQHQFQWHNYVDGYYDDYERFGIKSNSFIPSLKEFLFPIVFDEQNWSKIPILHLLWGAPFTTYLAFIIILFALYRKKYQYLLPAMLIFGLILTVALSPVMLFRYLLPAVICLPIMLYILIRTMLK